MKRKYLFDEGFSLVELLVVLVIIGILVLLALPRLMPIVTKAKTTEAKLNLKQIHMLEKAFKFEQDKYSMVLSEIGFEQEKLVTEGGPARYKINIISADVNTFKAIATSVVDFDNDGTFNQWEVNEDGQIKEVIQD
ncbi:MAG TPA: prepilin-type N-terminal cleavage/methylation domain-containing protein [Ignavibacteriaceae bacterium]|nr:prepilin-type N-terminal cleavage/methylation domain-containing protein [Ignavibacteriaceae bacterium]